jgi:thiosulfate dehydrogenase [quinone] large subunit
LLNKDLSETEYQELTSSQEQWDTEKQREISRRHLLKLMKIGGGVAASATLLAACGGGDDTTSTSGSTTTATQAPTQASTPAPATQPAQGASTGGKVLAKASDVPVNSAITFPIANQKNPGVLVHISEGKFVAFDSTCTHAQCAVTYQTDTKLLACPCHGATFDPAKNGAVVSPPAPSPLTPVKITVNADGAITLA